MRNARTSNKRVVAGWIALLALVCTAVLLLVGAFHPAHAASIGLLQQQVSAAQGKVSSLSGQLGAAQSQLSQLDGNIASLERQVSSIQADLNVKRARLIKLEEQFNAAETRLAQLEAEEARGERILAQQVVNNYETDQPDLVSVVLESNGFQDLLERLSFANRIQRQNAQVVARVRRERRAVASQVLILGSLERRQQRLTTQVLRERNGLDAVKVDLIRQRIAVVQIRNSKAGQLANERGRLSTLQHQLNKAEAAQASGSAGTAAPGYAYPFPGGWTPGRLDQGYDGTFSGNLVSPISGVVTYASQSFENWGGYLEIRTSDGSDIPGLATSTLYFAEGLFPTVTAGQSVSAGQTIATAGTIGAQAAIPGNIEWGAAKPASVGTPTDPLEAGAQAVLTFAQWAETELGLAPPSSTDHAGMF